MAGGYGGSKSWYTTFRLCGQGYKFCNHSKRTVDPKTLRVVPFAERASYVDGRLVDNREGLLGTDVHELACLRHERLAAKAGGVDVKR